MQEVNAYFYTFLYSLFSHLIYSWPYNNISSLKIFKLEFDSKIILLLFTYGYFLSDTTHAYLKEILPMQMDKHIKSLLL